MKIIRRGIIVICLIYLIGVGIDCLPESKYYNKELEALVKQGKAQVIEVDENLKIDDAKMHIKRLINTDEYTYVRYSYIRKESGWPVLTAATKLFDHKGKEYSYQGGSSSEKPWGTERLIKFDRLDNNVRYVIIKIENYDRKNQIKISLRKEGEINEN